MEKLKFKVGDEVKTSKGIGRILLVDDYETWQHYLVGIHGIHGHCGNTDDATKKKIIEQGYENECWWFIDDDVYPCIKNGETVNHPSHYNQSKHECIDEMVALFGVDAVIGFCKCNVHKYRSRAQFKGGDEDLKKSDWYMDKLLEIEEKKNDQGN